MSRFIVAPTAQLEWSYELGPTGCRAPAGQGRRAGGSAPSLYRERRPPQRCRRMGGGDHLDPHWPGRLDRPQRRRTHSARGDPGIVRAVSPSCPPRPNFEHRMTALLLRCDGVGETPHACGIRGRSATGPAGAQRRRPRCVEDLRFPDRSRVCVHLRCIARQPHATTRTAKSRDRCRARLFSVCLAVRRPAMPPARGCGAAGDPGSRLRSARRGPQPRPW